MLVTVFKVKYNSPFYYFYAIPPVAKKNVQRQGDIGRISSLMFAEMCGLLRSSLVAKNFAKFFKIPPHRIFGRMHEALNINKK